MPQPPVARSPSLTALVELIRSWVAETLGVASASVSPHERFRELGVDSMTATTLAVTLQDRLGRAVPVTAVWQYPTIAKLARHLSEAPTAEPTTTFEREARGPAPDRAEPIAIVGLGCRLPGGLDDPHALWRALTSGFDGIREVPAERWHLEDWFDDDAQAPGRMSTRWGGFVDDIDAFDAPFFAISPREATQMDPQQRLALQTTWRALQDAAIVPSTLQGTRTGVFFGAMWQGYPRVAGNAASAIAEHSAVGWDTSIIPARVSYRLGLVGPALTVNTACSSSLVAIHLGIQSLQRGESSLAIAGGINLMVAPHSTVMMTKFGAMNPKGQCRAFDADANGYVRGEGCGVVVLRPLSEALAAGDRIYAVIRGSAINNDGFSNGLTAPNPDAQADVYRRAWQRADIGPAEVQYVETHGPGTILGDPIEASSLGQVFAPDRTAPLHIGSIKTNLGHLEAAAGIAGLLKTALALHHGMLPPNLHFRTPNPRIDWNRNRLQVVAKATEWPASAIRRAGVNSFGFGGTNAHVALEEAPHRARWAFAIAAPDPDSLQHAVAALANEVRSTEGPFAWVALAGRRWPRPLAHGRVRAQPRGSARPAGAGRSGYGRGARGARVVGAPVRRLGSDGLGCSTRVARRRASICCRPRPLGRGDSAGGRPGGTRRVGRSPGAVHRAPTAAPSRGAGCHGGAVGRMGARGVPPSPDASAPAWVRGTCPTHAMLRTPWSLCLSHNLAKGWKPKPPSCGCKASPSTGRR